MKYFIKIATKENKAKLDYIILMILSIMFAIVDLPHQFWSYLKLTYKRILSLANFCLWCCKMKINPPRDEFDISYSFNPEMYFYLSKINKKAYMKKLLKYRNNSHEMY